MRKKYPFLYCIFLVSFFLSPLIWREAVVECQVFDSIQASFKKNPRLIGGFDTKNTFINGFRSPIFTARAGLDYNNLIRIGAGISWLKLSGYEIGSDNTPFYLDKELMDVSGMHTVHPALQFRYMSVFLDYLYYKTKKWQFSIPIQFGLGDSRYKYNFNGHNVIENRHVIFLYEPAVSGQYKIVKWFGVGLDVGYRMMIISNKKIGSKFNSPVYEVGTILFWGELYNMLFPNTKFAKRIKNY